jgi:hypothetical protein
VHAEKQVGEVHSFFFIVVSPSAERTFDFDPSPGQHYICKESFVNLTNDGSGTSNGILLLIFSWTSAIVREAISRPNFVKGARAVIRDYSRREEELCIEWSSIREETASPLGKKNRHSSPSCEA